METVLKRWMEYKGVSVSELARRIDKTSSFVSEYSSVPKVLRPRTIKMFADALEVNQDEFLAGPPSGFAELIRRGDFELIGQKVITASRAYDEPHPYFVIAIHKDYLDKSTQAKAKDLFFMQVHSEAMSPAIKQGDIILINTLRKDVSGGIFLVKNGGHYFLRRVTPQFGGELLLTSDNEGVHFPSIRLNPEDVEIIGLVTWVGRKIAP